MKVVFTIYERVGHLGQYIAQISQTNFYFIPQSYGCSVYNLAIISRAVLEKMIESNGHMLVYRPWAGADNSLRSSLS